MSKSAKVVLGRLGDFQSKRLGCGQVHDEIEPRRLLDPGNSHLSQCRDALLLLPVQALVAILQYPRRTDYIIGPGRV